MIHDTAVLDTRATYKERLGQSIIVYVTNIPGHFLNAPLKATVFRKVLLHSSLLISLIIWRLASAWPCNLRHQDVDAAEKKPVT